LYEADAAGGKRACKMIARSLLQSHDHKNLINRNYYFSTQGFLITGIFIIIDFSIGFYGHVSSAGNSKIHFASPLPACRFCLIHVVVYFTSLNFNGIKSNGIYTFYLHF